MALRLGFALNFRTSSRDIDDVARVYDKVIDTIVYADSSASTARPSPAAPSQAAPVPAHS
jgi:hypothetical protein